MHLKCSITLQNITNIRSKRTPIYPSIYIILFFLFWWVRNEQQSSDSLLVLQGIWGENAAFFSLPPDNMQALHTLTHTAWTWGPFAACSHWELQQDRIIPPLQAQRAPHESQKQQTDILYCCSRWDLMRP